MRIKLFALFTSISLIYACGQQTFDQKMQSLYNYTVPLITAGELDSLKNSELVILDIREKSEYDISHLEGARLVPYDDFDKKFVASIPKKSPIIVYCSVGYRSERIGEKLIEMGYTNVKNLYGGIFDWKNKGYSIINNQNQPTDSVHTYNESWSEWLYNGIKVYE